MEPRRRRGGGRNRWSSFITNTNGMHSLSFAWSGTYLWDAFCISPSRKLQANNTEPNQIIPDQTIYCIPTTFFFLLLLFFYSAGTNERVGIAVTIYNCIQKYKVSISAWLPLIVMEFSRGFPQYPKASAGIKHWNRPWPPPFKFLPTHSL